MTNIKESKIKIEDVLQCAGDLKISLSNHAYKTYKTTVKGNVNTSKGQALKKLCRNILLSDRKIYNTKRVREGIVKYGCLSIYIDYKIPSIVHVKNFSTPPKDWEKNIKLYNELNDKFGIIVD